MDDFESLMNLETGCPYVDDEIANYLRAALQRSPRFRLVLEDSHVSTSLGKDWLRRRFMIAEPTSIISCPSVSLAFSERPAWIQPWLLRAQTRNIDSHRRLLARSHRPHAAQLICDGRL